MNRKSVSLPTLAISEKLLPLVIAALSIFGIWMRLHGLADLGLQDWDIGYMLRNGRDLLVPGGQTGSHFGTSLIYAALLHFSTSDTAVNLLIGVSNLITAFLVLCLGKRYFSTWIGWGAFLFFLYFPPSAFFPLRGTQTVYSQTFLLFATVASLSAYQVQRANRRALLFFWLEFFLGLRG